MGAHSMEIVADQLSDGHNFRSLKIVDNYSRQCLAIEGDQGIKAGQVVRVMERLQAQHGSIPERIKVNDGSKFISRALPNL